MIKRIFWGMNCAFVGIFLNAMPLAAEDSEFYSTGDTLSNQWADPNLPSKKPLSYGSGYVEGYQEGYTTGYDEGYQKGAKASSASHILTKNTGTNEYFQGIREGFQKGYADGLEKGIEDHQRWVGKRSEPQGQKQVRVWTFQWGYFGAYWNLSEVRKSARG